VVHFYYWEDFLDHISRNYNEMKYYSISPSEIKSNLSSSSSIEINILDFSGVLNACFIIGEKDGLTTQQKLICDNIIHVKVPISHLETLVTYDSKIAICLQQYCESRSQFSPVGIIGEKHAMGDVDIKHVKTVRLAQLTIKGGGVGAEYSAVEAMQFDEIANLFAEPTDLS
jgi:hypothetical protein